LSVLVPSWNAAATVERALESVLEEVAVPLEVVVVDDGSTDGTADVAAAVAARDPRVTVIRLPDNQGVSNARNRGLEVARGEWLTFLDADDRLLPGGIAALMRPTSDQSLLAVIGQRIWTDGERTWLSAVYDIPDIREPGRKSIATHPGLLSYASATGKVLHRSLVEGLRFEGRVMGDQPWTITALLRAGDHIEVIGDTVYEWWRPHPDRYVETITAATRASSGRAAEAAVMAAQAFREVSAELETTIDDPVVRRSIQTAYLDRLVRSDLSTMIRALLERRDPGIGQLFDAVADLLTSVPAPVVAASLNVPTGLLRPPLRRWSEVARTARPAYWHLLRTAILADPAMPRRVATGRWGGRLLSGILAVEAHLGSRAADSVLLAIKGVRRLRPRR
jgi:Glycosyl transferase family 2